MNVLFSDFKERAEKVIEQAAANFKDVAEEPFPEGLAIGVSITLFENEDLQLEVLRKDENTFEYNYRHKPSGDLILQRLETEGGASLEMFDSFFWTVLVNSKAATQSQLDSLFDRSFAFKVDHNNRVLHLKI